MISDYSNRAFQDGDAEGVNSLYERVTGSKRTQTQFEWQWLEAPGGKSEIWLIEAVHEDGKTELIGHHGVMPIRFSFGSEDLLFGKTENTLVLPEFRRKILYTRFERLFLSHYESRFDALFSTLGPSAAIRQRQALGYEYPSKFVNFKFRTGAASDVAYLGSRLGRFVSHRERKAEQLPYGFNINQWHVRGSPDLNLRILDDATAAEDPFFDNFWSDVRDRFGLTPRRDAEDLNWRFWNNPYKNHIVFVSDAADSDQGYVVLSRSVAEPDSAVVEDIVPCDRHPESFARLLQSVLCWLRASPIRWLSFWTTDESCQAGGITSGLAKYNLHAFTLERKMRRLPDRYMPRKVNRNGPADEISVRDWYVTPIIFEGRVTF